MTTAIFLDTNIYLHFQPVEDIDWCDLFETDDVTLAVARIVFAQLDKVKETGAMATLRDRARRTSHILEEYATGKCDRVRERVSILLLHRAPNVDYVELGLDPGVYDDRLIASMLSYRAENPDSRIILVSDDTGPRVKAHAFGIAARTLPEEYRLPRQPDPYEKELRKLKRKVQILEAAQPNLCIQYADGKVFHRFVLQRGLEGDRESAVRARLEEERRRWPKRSVQRHTGPVSIADVARLSRISDDERERYNTEVEQYLRAFEAFLRKDWEVQVRESRALTLELFLANDGGSPAEDIDILLHFPDGFSVFDPAETNNPLACPSPPVEPRPPRTASEILAEALLTPTFNAPRLEYPLFDTSDIVSGNVSGPSIRRSNSYDVSFHIERLKQNLREALPAIGILFHSDDGAASFKVPFRINAAELPEDETGEVHVVVDRGEAADG
jgi:hypothetical protein